MKECRLLDGDTVEHAEDCMDHHRPGTQTDVRTLRVLSPQEIASRSLDRQPRSAR